MEEPVRVQSHRKIMELILVVQVTQQQASEEAGAGGAGGDWANGAGGYVGTWGDDGDCDRGNGVNGISVERKKDTVGTKIASDGSTMGTGSDAASYFTYGKLSLEQYEYGTNKRLTKPQVGGQGGLMHYLNGYFTTGSGGKAGNGGNVVVSKDSKVYAYNGDRITNGDYSSPIYDYDKDGNRLSSTCYVLKKHGTNEQTSPIKIFAQNGILREVRYTNFDWGNKPTTGWNYFYSIFGDQLEQSVKSITKPTSYETAENCLIRTEKNVGTTGYTNPETKDCYGIGSGAGYMEVSNGTYKIDKNLN